MSFFVNQSPSSPTRQPLLPQITSEPTKNVYSVVTPSFNIGGNNQITCTPLTAAHSAASSSSTATYAINNAANKNSTEGSASLLKISEESMAKFSNICFSIPSNHAEQIAAQAFPEQFKSLKTHLEEMIEINTQIIQLQRLINNTSGRYFELLDSNSERPQNHKEIDQKISKTYEQYFCALLGLLATSDLPTSELVKNLIENSSKTNQAFAECIKQEKVNTAGMLASATVSEVAGTALIVVAPVAAAAILPVFLTLMAAHNLDASKKLKQEIANNQNQNQTYVKLWSGFVEMLLSQLQSPYFSSFNETTEGKEQIQALVDCSKFFGIDVKDVSVPLINIDEGRADNITTPSSTA